MMKHRQNRWWIGVILIAVFALSGRLTLAQDTYVCGTDSGEGCASPDQLVDVAIPSFSDPTTVTNPLFPISDLHRVLLMGTVDGFPFRTETTLLPYTKTIDWNGQPVETLVSQYVAFLDGRIEEVALDWYAQANDGSVWYFGEDVFNYADGQVADTNGTWLAGQDGPAAMIMPGSPQVGDVYRPENSPGIVFEEVTVTSVSETVQGPRGLIEGAIVTDELYMDGTRDAKIFAPGYGEFLTGSGGTLEAVALALPTDALNDPLPAELITLSDGAAAIFTAAEAGDWNSAAATLDTMLTAWDTYQTGDVPRMLDATMSWAIVELVAAVNARQPVEARQAAINVNRSSLDLQLRYRPVVEIDFALFDLWAQQILVDVATEDTGAVAGDVTTLEWVWDRIAHTVSDASLVEGQLASLREAADGEDLAAAAEFAAQLRDTIATLMPATS